MDFLRFVIGSIARFAQVYHVAIPCSIEAAIDDLRLLSKDGLLFILILLALFKAGENDLVFILATARTRGLSVIKDGNKFRLDGSHWESEPNNCSYSEFRKELMTKKDAVIKAISLAQEAFASRDASLFDE